MSADSAAQPGTRGLLPADFSRSKMAVKFRDNRDIKLSDGMPGAVGRSENAALHAVLAKYPGTGPVRWDPHE